MKNFILPAALLLGFLSPEAAAQPTPTPPSMPVPYTENFNGPWAGGAPSNYPNIWSKQFISGTTNWGSSTPAASTRHPRLTAVTTRSSTRRTGPGRRPA